MVTTEQAASTPAAERRRATVVRIVADFGDSSLEGHSSSGPCLRCIATSIGNRGIVTVVSETLGSLWRAERERLAAIEGEAPQPVNVPTPSALLEFDCPRAAPDSGGAHAITVNVVPLVADGDPVSILVCGRCGQSSPLIGGD